VNVNGQSYVVQVSEGGDVSHIAAARPAAAPAAVASAAAPAGKGEAYRAPLAGSIVKVMVKVGQNVAEGQVLLVMEAMKMETELMSPLAGVIHSIAVAEGNAVAVGDELLQIGCTAMDSLLKLLGDAGLYQLEAGLFVMLCVGLLLIYL